MSLLRANKLAFAYAGSADPIFSNISFHISPRDRIGLIGQNGGGKTTLLRLLLGELFPTEGEITLAPGISLASTHQVCEYLDAGNALDYVLAADPELFRLKVALIEAEKRLEEEAMALLYADLLQAYAERDGYAIEARAQAILTGLNVPADAPLGQLSGGEKTRTELARILLCPGDLLFLDEPTNHLDGPAQDWLLGYLKPLPAAIVVVSHDRAFLDALVERIFELRNHTLEVATKAFGL
jgi:ATP-binding cassette subfamily F protein 3